MNNISQMKTPTWCNTVQVLFLQGHSTWFGRKRPSSGVFKTSTEATGTCVIVAGKSSHLLIRRCDYLPVEWLCRNKTCTMLHQVGLSLHIYIMIYNWLLWLYSALLWFDSLMWMVCFYEVLLLFRKKWRADWSQAMLAIVRCRIFCLPVCYPKI